jgi:hypothetical protein
MFNTQFSYAVIWRTRATKPTPPQDLTGSTSANSATRVSLSFMPIVIILTLTFCVETEIDCYNGF